MWNYSKTYKDDEVLALGATRRGLLLGIGLSLLSACQGRPQARYPSADVALSQLNSQSNCSRAVMGDADLVVSNAFFEMRGKLLYLAQAPNRLRFDLYSSFGVTLSTLTSDGRNFALYSLDKESFWYGPTKTCNLAKFTQVPVPAFALVELLRGRAPLLEHAPHEAKIRYVRPIFGAGHYVIDIRGANEAVQRLRVAVPQADWEKPLKKQRLRLLFVRVKQGGKLLYQVKLDEYREAQLAALELTAEEIEMGLAPRSHSGPNCSAELPGRLKFAVPDAGYSLTIENHESFHNPPLVAGAFTQSVPSGVRSEFSDCSD